MTADQLKDLITAGLACEHITLEGDGRLLRVGQRGSGDWRFD